MRGSSQIQIAWQNSTRINIPDDISKPNSRHRRIVCHENLEKSVFISYKIWKGQAAMPPAPRLPSATGTTRARGLGFSTNETKALHRSIEKYLPIGGLEWDTVVSEHEGLFPLEQRTKEALKRKFALLHNRRMALVTPIYQTPFVMPKELLKRSKTKRTFRMGRMTTRKEFRPAYKMQARISLARQNFGYRSPFVFALSLTQTTNQILVSKHRWLSRRR